MTKKIEDEFTMVNRFKEENRKRNKRILRPGDTNFYWTNANQIKNVEITEEKVSSLIIEIISDRSEHSLVPITKAFLRKQLIKFCLLNCREFDKSERYYSYLEDVLPIEKMKDSEIEKAVKRAGILNK